MEFFRGVDDDSHRALRASRLGEFLEPHATRPSLLDELRSLVRR